VPLRRTSASNETATAWFKPEEYLLPGSCEIRYPRRSQSNLLASVHQVSPLRHNPSSGQLVKLSAAARNSSDLGVTSAFIHYLHAFSRD
jgi:hypothetical protein